MDKDKIVVKGWYRLTLASHQRYTGKCLSIVEKDGKPFSYTFDIGEAENEKIVQKPHFLILHIDDIASSTRLSPRYIEQIVTRKKGWTIIRYKGLLKYGEE